MKFLKLMFIKNKKTILVITIYEICYLFLLNFIKKNYISSLYYQSTLETKIFFLFHGFFDIIISCTLFNEFIKTEIIIRYSREKFVLNIIEKIIIFSIITSIVINFITFIFFKDITAKNMYYTIVITMAYFVVISLGILNVYGIFKNIKVSFLIVNCLNFFPIIIGLTNNKLEKNLITENYINIR